MKKPRQKSGLAGAGWMAAVFLGVAVLFVFLDEDTQAPQARQAPRATSSPAPSEASVPPYHRSAESARPFPATLDPARFEIRVVSRAYEIAREIPEVLAQQPCYCNCESFGHGSLLDCFASDHGATWTICIKEVFLARELTDEGRTPSQIRDEIVRGAFRAIDLEHVE